MLVLSRKCNQQLTIANDIEVTVLSIKGGRVQLGINAPKHVSIQRAELLLRIDTELGSASNPLLPPAVETKGATA
ncbi:hypothetical protein Pla52o_17680 [Novipirellula galeiformis]|uniref:Translational regulator CsrA n=1 Tax=Novipirellula galeiformis TaxID=2528004 RepID=A0A5C6CPE0_9BACT|nr:carbon storage regulator CsrA [Novipirellula galeiformis]TWU25467.1 hypothetical protein Pla52o_17680 [Novipirellula galeiformis]